MPDVRELIFDKIALSLPTGLELPDFLIIRRQNQVVSPRVSIGRISFLFGWIEDEWFLDFLQAACPVIVDILLGLNTLSAGPITLGLGKSLSILTEINERPNIPGNPTDLQVQIYSVRS